MLFIAHCFVLFFYHLAGYNLFVCKNMTYLYRQSDLSACRMHHSRHRNRNADRVSERLSKSSDEQFIQGFRYITERCEHSDGLDKYFISPSFHGKTNI